ncbi:hypothetical protein RMSM_03623 [Rhodopirellula maiorica SM1]|uniref:Uncharacterized protein n=1 Tax=Rhodopirellula maiorica SM1 TaxID=1265738 RepID=M5RJT8_9BACT|nr:hypothetical protein [Rhodopirellula maiorica]EMI19451.1 hypothetical protein RMSM_03623 [Rhodopirellula maiorica SM1]
MKTIASHWLDSSDEVTWLVCEQSSRWADAARRFSSEGLPDPWIPQVTSCEPSEVPRRIARHPWAKTATHRRIPVVVLWELTPESIAGMLLVVTQVKATFPEVIQLAGIVGIPRSMHPAISELGISFSLAAPEALQNVAQRINPRAFAVSSPDASAVIASAWPR